MIPSDRPKSDALLLNEIYGSVGQIAAIFYWITALLLFALIAGIFIVLSNSNYFTAEFIAFNILPVILSFFLIRNRKFELVATALAVVFITSITLIATLGQGIHHLSVVGYPVVIIIASLIIRKRIMALLVSYNILCVAWLVFGDILGFYQTIGVERSVPGDFFTVSVILIATAVMVRSITEIMFRNSTKLQQELRERKRIEDALAFSEKRFYQAFHSSPVMMTLEVNGIFTDANPAFLETSGYQLDEVIGRNANDISLFGSDEDRETLRELNAKQQKIRDVEMHFRRKSGEIGVALLSSDKFDVDGKTHDLTSALDITERKRSEENLRKAEEKYRTIFNDSVQGIYQSTPDGKFITANPALAHMWGYKSPEDLISSIQDIGTQIYVDSRRRDELTALLRKDGRAYGFEFEVRRKDGTTMWASGNARAVCDPLGALLYYEGYIEDITTRKQAEQLIHDNEEKYRLLFENAPVGILLINTRGKIIEVNPTALQILGSPSAEATKQINVLNFPPLIQAGISVDFQKVVDTGQPNSGEYPYTTKWGKSIYISTRLIPIFDAHRNVERVQVIFEDITERKQAENRILRLNRLYATTSQINQTIVRTRDRETLFQDICHVVVERGQFRMAWIGLVNEKERLVSPAFFSGDEQGYLETIGTVKYEDVESGRGPTGTAIREQRCIIIQDISTNPRMKPWREQALQRGYRSSAAVPFYQGGRVAGALTVYASELQAFDVEDEKLLDEIGKDISFALDTMQLKAQRQAAEEALRKSAEEYEYVVSTSLDGFVRIDQQGRIIETNEAFCRLFGYNREEVFTIGINELAATSAGAQIYGIMSQLGEGGQTRFEARLPHRDGHMIDAEVNAIYDQPSSQFIAFVRDITERKQAQALQNAVYQIAMASEATISLDELYPKIHQIISSVMPAENFYITLYDESKNVLKFPYFKDKQDEPYLGEIEPGKGLTAYVLKTGKSLLCNQTVHDELERRGEVKLLGVPSAIWLGVPLINEGKTIGAMVVQHYTDPKAYNEREQHILEFVSSQVANAINRKQAEEALRESEEKFRGLFENAHDALMVLESPSWKFTSGNPACVKMFAAKDEAEFTSYAPWELSPEKQPDGRASSEKARQMIDIAVRDGFHFFEWTHRRISGEEFLADVLLIRLQQKGETILQATVRDITEHKKAEQQIHRQLERLMALKNIDQIITTNFDLKISLDMLLVQIVDQLKVDAVNVLVFNPTLNRMEFRSGRGFRIHSFEREYVRLGDDYAGRAALEHHTIHIADLNNETDNTAFLKVLRNEGFISYYCVPLFVKGRIKGALEIFHRSALNPDSEWLEFLETLSQRIAVAIDNIELFENLQRSRDELSLAYNATIEGWSRALDLRDEETEGHTQRVTEMTLKLAREFDFSEEELTQIQRGALLHDIGKLGVPDSILFKPGDLTENEWKVMRKHPVLAYEMLIPIQYLGRAINIPYCHHEKWDGSGYPRGLSGEQIPLEARIFAVVDVWDAVTSKRPYRAAWSEQKAIEYLRSLSGTHLDPHIVERFLEWQAKGPPREEG